MPGDSIPLQPHFPHPMRVLAESLDRARELHDPWARFVCLATSNENGEPRSRIITVRYVDENELVLSVHRNSPKMDHLEANSHFECLFYWHSLQLQIRLRGKWQFLSKHPKVQSKKPWRVLLWDWYLDRHRQSDKVERPLAIEGEVNRLESKLLHRYEDRDAVPEPKSAGYLQIRPTEIEFQYLNDQTRIHDRRLYRREESGDWQEIFLRP